MTMANVGISYSTVAKSLGTFSISSITKLY